jgi:hypothetical protein
VEKIGVPVVEKDLIGVKTVSHMESPTVLLGEDLPFLQWATHGNSDCLLFVKHFIISSKKYF